MSLIKYRGMRWWDVDEVIIWCRFHLTLFDDLNLMRFYFILLDDLMLKSGWVIVKVIEPLTQPLTLLSPGMTVKRLHWRLSNIVPNPYQMTVWDVLWGYNTLSFLDNVILSLYVSFTHFLVYGTQQFNFVPPLCPILFVRYS